MPFFSFLTSSGSISFALTHKPLLFFTILFSPSACRETCACPSFSSPPKLLCTPHPTSPWAHPRSVCSVDFLFFRTECGLSNCRWAANSAPSASCSAKDLSVSLTGTNFGMASEGSRDAYERCSHDRQQQRNVLREETRFPLSAFLGGSWKISTAL